MHIVFLSTEQVEAIHNNQIETYDGLAGIKDCNLLESAIAAPKATFSGQFLYPTVYLMAAAYFFSLANNHAFNDGNKRTAVVTVSVFLYMNGYLLEVSEHELIGLAAQTVEQKYSREQIAAFLENHAKKRVR